MSDMEFRRDGDWGREPARQPPVAEDETLIFNEPGRILRRAGQISGGVDYRSHCFSIVRKSHGGTTCF